MKGKFDNWAFGCDICQDICPWNKFASPHNEPLFTANKTLLNLSKAEWLDLEEETFQAIAKSSPLKRTKYKGLKRNLDFIRPA